MEYRVRPMPRSSRFSSRSGLSCYAVHDAETECVVGVIGHQDPHPIIGSVFDPPWLVVEAGDGVPVDQNDRYATYDQALTALHEVRTEYAWWLEVGPSGLTGMEQWMLDAERYVPEMWRTDGWREEAIHFLFRINSTRYHQVLARLINGPRREAALAYDHGNGAQTVRLLEERSARNRARKRRRPDWYLDPNTPIGFQTDRGVGLQIVGRDDAAESPSSRPDHVMEPV